MKPDPRRTLRSLAVAGALLIAVPAPTYAQDITASLTTPPFVVHQDADGNDNSTVSGTEQGSGGGGVLIVSGPQPFLRTAVSGNATDMEAAQLALERSENRQSKQFASLILRQSQMMMDDASRAASTAGIGAAPGPNRGR